MIGYKRPINDLKAFYKVQLRLYKDLGVNIDAASSPALFHGVP